MGDRVNRIAAIGVGDVERSRAEFGGGIGRLRIEGQNRLGREADIVECRRGRVGGERQFSDAIHLAATGD